MEKKAITYKNNRIWQQQGWAVWDQTARVADWTGLGSDSIWSSSGMKRIQNQEQFFAKKHNNPTEAIHQIWQEEWSLLC